MNDAAVAGLYSQLAGVLAGFAFTVLAALFLSPLSERRGPSLTQERRSAVELLVSAFFGLVSSALSYAVLTGIAGVETNNHETPIIVAAQRLAILHTVAGVGFGASFLALVTAVVFLLKVSGPDVVDGEGSTKDSRQRKRRGFDVYLLGGITIVLAPAVMLQYVASGVWSAFTLFDGPLPLHWLLYWGTLFLWLVALGYSGFRVMRAFESNDGDRILRIARSTFAAAVVVISFLSTSMVSFLAIPTMGAVKNPAVYLYGVLIISIVAAVLAGCTALIPLFSTATGPSATLGSPSPLPANGAAGTNEHGSSEPNLSPVRPTSPSGNEPQHVARRLVKAAPAEETVHGSGPSPMPPAREQSAGTVGSGAVAD